MNEALLGFFGRDRSARSAAGRLDDTLRGAAPADAAASAWHTYSDAHASLAVRKSRGGIAANERCWVALIGGAKRSDGECRPASEIALRVADAYAGDGRAAAEQLRGPFGVALWDRLEHRGVIAVDRLGIQPLFVLPGDGELVFADSPAGIRRLSPSDLRLNDQSLFDYLYFHMVPAPDCVFERVVRLQPGECVEWQDGALTHSRYWSMRFEETATADFPSLKNDFLAALRDGVRGALGPGKNGAFLSGGTDSSTIAGLMGEIQGAPASTYSIGFAAKGYDEMEYARIAARHFDTDHHEYYVTADDIVDLVPRLAAVHDQPFGNSSAVPTYYCGRLAKDDGVDRMIGGDGGDELFGGNARYAKQYVFSLYERIPEAMRRALIEPATDGLARAAGVGLIRKARSYVQQASVPMPARTETYNFLNRIGYAAALEHDFLARVDVGKPVRMLEAAYFNPTAHSLINRMLSLDLKFTLADNDLPKVVGSCALAGLPVAFPMLDERVVEFSARLPPDLKLRGTRLRYFFKQALRDFLPAEILGKQKHGFGLPFGFWAATPGRLQDFAFASLDSLKGRGIVRPDFLDRLKGDLQVHPGYYGTIIWVLMMLEQWFQHHLPQGRTSS